ncbi:MAG: glucose-6-phosphate isomerase [Bacteroidales bacterium]|nr:glucose-6-phosphate isomerase [Bacteroidales bacterium]
MIQLQFHSDSASRFIPADLFEQSEKQIQTAYQQLVRQTGAGNDFLGWLDLPEAQSADELSRICQVADRLARLSEVVVVIGIGGSYLGARAVIEALQGPFHPFMNDTRHPQVLFAGNNISEDYLFDLQQILNKKDYSIVVISKSGTTTEPAIAFRIFKEHCEKKYGKAEARERIVAITDRSRGALKQLADQEGYDTFVIPDNVGGRYSVLTPVGLLPIAIAGLDIHRLLDGARQMRACLTTKDDTTENPAMQYAVIRNFLYHNGKKVELMVSYDPSLFYFIEWYKQLFGESEGKENRGIFPAGCIFSTDLHSLGQYVQEGERILFETVISVNQSHHTLAIPYDEQNTDGLNYLQKRKIHDINLIAEEGTRMAHVDGGVPNLRITIPEISENSLGEMIYFFEFTCALGGYLLNINPFDQPGVEAYKRNMFKLLGK